MKFIEMYNTKFFLHALLILLLTFPALLGQSITEVEYYIDSDPGFGNATPLAFTLSGDTALINESISSTGFGIGHHNLFLRAKNDLGIWSNLKTFSFVIEDQATFESATITEAEYFIDNDDGLGANNPLPVNLVGGQFCLDDFVQTSALTSGNYNLHIRAKNELGIWSHYKSFGFYISLPSVITNFETAEYFFDTDPGFGNGLSLPFSLNGDTLCVEHLINSAALPPGFHNLHIRVLTDDGKWSQYKSLQIYVDEVLALQNDSIVSFEYFFDTDPGLGNGNSLLAFSQTNMESCLDDLVSTAGLGPGFHNLFVRSQNSDGDWSIYKSFSVMIDEAIPMDSIVRIEYFINSDPGLGNGMSLPFTYNQDSACVIDALIPTDSSLNDELTHYLFVRAQDSDGNWSFLEAFPFNLGCTLNIQLNQGWNIISSNCLPPDLAMEAIFSEIDEEVIQVKNLSGTYVPSFMFNSIGDWDITNGYQIKVSSDTVLKIKGIPIDPESTPIVLDNGWNIMAYLLDEALSPIIALDEIKSEIIQVKNLFGTYVPSFGDFNSMGDLTPSQGYQIKVTGNQNFTYDPADLMGLKPSSNEATQPVFYDLTGRVTNLTSTILIPNPPQGLMEEGDEIGVFNETGMLVGAMLYQNKNMGTLIYGDDALTLETDGMMTGEKYYFRKWDALLEKESSLDLEFFNGPDYFVIDEISKARFKTQLNTDLTTGIEQEITSHKIKISPNPTIDQLYVLLDLPSPSETLSLEIYNGNGKIVQTNRFEGLSAGVHLFVEELGTLPNGIYQLRILDGKNLHVTKSFVKI